MKRFTAILLTAILVLTLASCGGEKTEYAVSVFFSDVALSAGESETEQFARIRSDAKISPEEITAVSSDPTVASVSMRTDGSYLWYDITGHAAGVAYVFFMCGGEIVSEQVTVTVSGGTGTETKNPTETTDPTTTAEPTDTEEAPTTEAAPITDATAVFITPTGTKYHLSRDCAGKNATETNYGAVKHTHEPCKKCAGG